MASQDCNTISYGARSKALRSEPSTQKKANRYIQLNRNLCHYPLARGAATTPPWQTKDCIRLMCPLHRDPATGLVRVILYLPFDKYDGQARAPNRYDMDVAYRLLGLTMQKRPEVIHDLCLDAGGLAIGRTEGLRRDKRLFYRGQPDTVPEVDPLALFNATLQAEGYDYAKSLKSIAGEPTPAAEKLAGKAAYAARKKQLMAEPKILQGIILQFPSRRALVRALGRNPNTLSNYGSIMESLYFLQDLRVGFFDCWHQPGKGKITRELGFVEIVEIKSNGEVWIKLDPAFLASALGYTVKTPLPLPCASDPALNLHLWARAWRRMKLTQEIERDFQTFTDMLGLAGDIPCRRSVALERTVFQVNQHRATHDQGPRLQVKARGSKIAVLPIYGG